MSQPPRHDTNSGWWHLCTPGKRAGLDDNSDDNRDDSSCLNHQRYNARSQLACLVTAFARSWQCGGSGVRVPLARPVKQRKCFDLLVSSGMSSDPAEMGIDPQALSARWNHRLRGDLLDCEP